MSYIDPHIHMVSRTTDDYRRMALSGCVAITEPAFWAGFDRSSPQGFYDYFQQLTRTEPARAALYGINHHCWLCINPKEAEDPGFAREVMAMIPDFLQCDNVLGIGEIGLNKNSKNEMVILEEHLAFAECIRERIIATLAFDLGLVALEKPDTDQIGVNIFGDIQADCLENGFIGFGV